MSDSLAHATIQQLNLGYDAVQDRLLLKMGLSDNSELSIWLTRRLVKGLWDLMQKTNIAPLVAPDVFSPETHELLKSFADRDAEQQALPNMDFSEAYQANRTSRTTEPMLATRCQIVQGNGQSALELQLEDDNMVRIPLSLELTVALGNMLQLATREAGWDMHLTPDHVMIAEPTTQHVLH